MLVGFPWDGGAGSSPRMRGKRRQRAVRRSGAGLIPAHAGKTTALGSRLTGAGAHPRACGENSSPSRMPLIVMGSSPRMRGKPLVRTLSGMPRGLIPAHAGKTTLNGSPAFVSWAHPRACGENPVYDLLRFQVKGSSPRMRGKHHALPFGYSSERLIPAHAGKTSLSPFFFSPALAHPRACGENLLGQRSGGGMLGSSPRMRGKPRGAPYLPRWRGLIPAHAGKTLATRRLRRRKRAHPRACGENRANPTLWQCVLGSSPRMRGKRITR